MSTILFQGHRRRVEIVTGLEATVACNQNLAAPVVKRRRRPAKVMPKGWLAALKQSISEAGRKLSVRR